MKHIYLSAKRYSSCLFIIFLFTLSNGKAQSINPYLYYSSCTGKATVDSGNYSKTTDKFESGVVTLTPNGPIMYNINPGSFTIGPNQTKSWSGTLTVDKNNPPAAGTSANAKLVVDYDLHYSRPAGTGHSGTVTSTYSCGGGCYYHKHHGGDMHELVHDVGTRNVDFTVYSIQVKIKGKKDYFLGDTIKLTADAFPGSGNLKWSDGKTGSQYTAIADKNKKLWVTYTVGGVSCTDTVQITVAAPGTWSFQTGPPPFPGWSSNLNKVDKLKTTVTWIAQKLPAKVQISGPVVAVSYKQRDCCKDAVVKPNGEYEVSGSITAGLAAKDIPCASPPYTAAFKVSQTFFGIGFTFEGMYGLTLDVAANVTGTLGYRNNDCIPQSCFTGGIGLDFPVSLNAGFKFKVCLEGQDTTKWWSIPCVGFQAQAVLSTRLQGGITYNVPNCNSGFGASAFFGPLNISFPVSIGIWTFKWSYDIINKIQLY